MNDVNGVISRLTVAWAYLTAAVDATARDWPPEARAMATVALRAMTAPMVVSAYGPDAQALWDLQARTHRAFGSPDGWGADTSIGRALAAFYAVSDRPPKAPAKPLPHHFDRCEPRGNLFAESEP